jgi:hypothetical protein
MARTGTRTRYYTATSLDGFIADPDNSLDWLFSVGSDDGAFAGEQDSTDRFAEFFAGVGAFAMGATTYLWVLDHEKLLDRPDTWQGWYDDRPCWVFTHRDLPRVPGADIRFVSGDVRPVRRPRPARRDHPQRRTGHPWSWRAAAAAPPHAVPAAARGSHPAGPVRATPVRGGGTGLTAVGTAYPDLTAS